MKNLFTFISVLLLTLFLALPVQAGLTTTGGSNPTLDTLFKDQTVYVGLCNNSTPTDSTKCTEVTGGNYAREIITFGTAAASRSISNTVAVTMNAPSADWCATDCTYVEIWDCLSCTTEANRLAFGVLSASGTITIENGDTGHVIPIGSVTVDVTAS